MTTLATQLSRLRDQPIARGVSAAAMLALLLPPLAPVFAQDQPQPAPAPAPQSPAVADPPARAGCLATLRGTVSTHAIDAMQWSAAALNQPLTNGDALWTQPKSTAAAQISASTITLNEATELDFSQLDAQTVAMAQPQGELFLHLQDLAQGEVWTVLTPRGAVRLTADGNYDIAAGSNGEPTLVTVLDGAADIAGQGIDLHVQPHQTATLTGAGPFDGAIGALKRDAFMDAQLAQARTVHVLPQGVPAYVGTMTGGDDLITTGQWQPTPQYGTVWYPPVQHDWVPYRDGHWSWVAPWGWTWVDDAPWGFAPSHYGRWVDVDGRWGWTPGEPEAREERPVYAPALVAFVGLGAGLLAGAALASHHDRGPEFAGDRSIGWVPLGPGEVYHPPYRVSQTYLQRVNVTNVKTVTTIINNTTEPNTARSPGQGAPQFLNASAATVVPAAALARGQAIGPVARPVPASVLATARPLSAAAPMATPGEAATPAAGALAQALPSPLDAHVRPVTPGPAINPAFARGQAPAVIGAPKAAPGPALAPVPAPSQSQARTASPAMTAGRAFGPSVVSPKQGVPGPTAPPAAQPGALVAPKPHAEPAVPRPVDTATPPHDSRPVLPTVQRPTSPEPAAAPNTPRTDFPHPAMPANTMTHPEMARPALPQVQMPRAEMAHPELPHPELPHPEMAHPEMARPVMPPPQMPRTEVPRPQARPNEGQRPVVPQQ